LGLPAAVAGKLSLQDKPVRLWIYLIIQDGALGIRQPAPVVGESLHVSEEIEEVRPRIDLGLIAEIMDGVGHSVFVPRSKSSERWCFTTVGHPRY
jgi:hypothetical protein